MLIHLLIAQCFYFSSAQEAHGFFDSLMKFFERRREFNALRPPDTIKVLQKYDFIVVGAGTAGCVLANRLTEIEHWKVLLIEAGGDEDTIMDIPLNAPFLQLSNANWRYKSEPSEFACLGIQNRRCPIPRGKVMGGSSTLNFMVHTRGDARDYDQWAAKGNRGWSWADVEPYFLKSEDLQINHNVDWKHHKQGGYMTFSNGYVSDLAKAFVRAGGELGYKIRDYNSGNIEGFSVVQSAVRNGSRLSTSQAYLHPIRKRKNLDVVKHALVTKVLIQNKKAVGVTYLKNRVTHTVRATKEVILSAGAINSPQLLIISGIGPKDQLNELKIPVIKDLPVGYNLQDHPAIGYVIFTVNRTDGISDETIYNVDDISEYMAGQNGKFSAPGGLLSVAFVDVFNDPDHQGFPDLEIQYIDSSPLSINSIHSCFRLKKENQEIYSSAEKIESYMLLMDVLRPKSVGRLYLKSKDPRVKPKIDVAYFTHPDDLKVLQKGVELAKNLSRTPSLQKYNAQIYDVPIPACAHHGRNTNRYWGCHAQHLTITNYHQCCTNKMGPSKDNSSVVDHRLRVLGIGNLRVIDASIMPTVISGHTNSPTIMIAEKGADMIKQDWNIKTN